MKSLFLISILALCLWGSTLQAEQSRLSIEHDGAIRSYQLYLPDSLPAAQPPALLMVLHGLRGNGQRVADLSGFNQRARQQGFIVVYPDSLGSRWNYLHGIPGAFAGPDDPGFLQKLVDQLSRTHGIDASRRYVTGISNGGFMAQRLACEAQPRFAGFASIAAGGYAAMPDNCTRRTPIDALYLHGTEDQVVPWKGREISDSSGHRQVVTLSVTQSLKFWARHNRCAADIAQREIESSPASNGTRVRVIESRSCAANAQVSLYAVLGGGHNWPGVEGAIPESIAGRVNLDIHASDVIWSFFEH